MKAYRKTKKYHNIYEVILKTLSMLLLLIMLLQYKFYFQYDFNENISDFKGIIYTISQNLFNKDPIVKLVFQNTTCSSSHKTINLLYWPGNQHGCVCLDSECQDCSEIQSTKSQYLQRFKDQYICVMTTKKYEINCQNNCPITNIYNEKKYVPTINNIPIVKLYQNAKISLHLQLISIQDLGILATMLGNSRSIQTLISLNFYIIKVYKSCQNNELGNITKQCKDPGFDKTNYHYLQGFQSDRFLQSNLNLKIQDSKLISNQTVYLFAETKIQLRNVGQCNFFNKEQVEQGEQHLFKLIVITWVFIILKTLTFILYILLELINYNLSKLQLHPLKFALLLIAILIIMNAIENFLILQEFQSLNNIITFYQNFGQYDCFQMQIINEYLMNCQKQLGGNSQYQDIMNFHYYVIASIIVLYVCFILLYPINEEQRGSLLLEDLLVYERLKENRQNKLLKYETRKISEHNSEQYTDRTHSKIFLEMQKMPES